MSHDYDRLEVLVDTDVIALLEEYRAARFLLKGLHLSVATDLERFAIEGFFARYPTERPEDE